jgi:hypothetical protein
MVPEQVNEGEPVTWTLTLKGSGNWPMSVELPARTIPNQIRTIQPKLRKEFNGTDIFTGAVVEDLVMIPKQSGEYELPSVKFVYFDPKKKSYEIEEAKPPKITVTKGAGGLSLTTPQPSGTANPASSTQEKAPSPAMATSKPAKPLQYGTPGLTREPLEGTGIGFGPLPIGVVLFVSFLPWVILLWIWWGWIQKRAIMTDTSLPQKEALKEWMDCVHRIRNAKSKEEIVRPLILWQQAVFKTLGIKTAAPRAGEIQKVKNKMISQENINGLYKSYRTVEDALYGIETGVKIGDWCEETKKIAAEFKFPPKRWRDVFDPKNVWPWMGVWIICLASDLAAKDSTQPTASTPPESAISLYREGRFEEAEKHWGEIARKNMSDPKSRNNLGLAWFQIGDKQRALANGLSAYLISPQTGTVNWNIRIFAAGADQLDPAIRELLEGTWGSWLTSQLGVLTWQVGLVVGSFGMAFGAGLWLAAGYFSDRKKILFPAAVFVGGCGLIITFLAGTALGVYGKLSDADAVMIVDVEPLRTVPTEVEPQVEKAYPPGSIAHLEKTFLGWSKIRMPNHDVGWIRTEHLVPLY